MTRFALAVIALATVAAASFQASAIPVKFKVKRVMDSHGPIYISLFSSPDAWDSEVPTQVLTMPVTVDESTLQVDLAAGDYAIFLYQDINQDGQLQKTTFGFPAEPYAFSNNVQIQFSKPSWDDLKFTISGDSGAETVKLNQP